MNLQRLYPLIVCSLLLANHTTAAQDSSWDVNQPDYSVDANSVSLDVTEGTWMSLDVAPDGQHIVFDLMGDIYLLPMEGGDARAVSSGHAWDKQPRFSPDGRHLAFTSDRAGGDNIWTQNLETGESRQVTHESFRLLNNPSWSPDGNYIAARKHFTTARSLGTGEIWLYHRLGGAEESGQKLVARPSKTFQKEQGEPTFSPAGDSLYYTVNATAGDTFIYHQDSNTEIFQIRRVDLASGDTTTVAGGPGGAVRPTPSPDGKQLAYVKRVRAVSRLFVMDLASGEERMVHDALDNDMQETWAVHGLYPNMAWTPDSQHIVFWAAGKIWKLQLATSALSEIPFRVRDQRDVYPAPRFKVDVSPARFSTRMVRFAQRSPDGRAVIFESLGQLYIQRGHDAPQPLTADAGERFEYSPVWAPDSGSIYFLRWDDRELSTLHRVGVNGGEAITLALAKGQYTELSMAADGADLALRKRSGSALLHPDWDNKPGLYLYNLDSGALHPISDRGHHPHFGPDGRLYAQERVDDKTQLISMTLTGHDVREIASASDASDIRLSPDGRHIAFINHYQVYLTAALPGAGVIELDAAKPAYPTVQLSRTGGAFLYWSDDGDSVSWSTGAEYREVSLAQALQQDYDGPAASTRLSVDVASAAPQTKLALTNARIVTMNDHREVIEGGTLLVRNNRIQALGKDIEIPRDYQQVDLQGQTVVPGFIDIHAHGPYGSGKIVPQQNWNLLAHLALGVTTVHNPSSDATLVFAAAEYARAGKILGPRIYSTGEIVYGAKSLWFSPVESLDDALAHVRRLKAQGAISIKNYNQPRREQRQQIIEAARQEGLMCVAEGGSLYHQDMNFIVDGITGVEHNVPTLRMYDDVTRLWSQSQAGYTPTLVVTFGGLTAEDYYYQETEVWKHPILSNFVPPGLLQSRSVRRPMAPESDYRDDDAAAAAKKLLLQGVLVNTGGHGQREGLATHWEMWSFNRGGFSPMEALAAATINPARYMGMEADIGSLEAGKLADMVIIRDNPLEDIRNSDHISHVVLNGRIYEADSLREVHSGNAEVSPFYWHNRPQSQIR